MESKKFYGFVLTTCLIFLFLIPLVATVQGAGVKDTHQGPLDGVPAVSADSLNRAFQTPTSLDYALQIDFTPTVTIYLASIMMNWPWVYARECESPDVYTVGRLIYRSNASNQRVHGQFGAMRDGKARSGYAKYVDIDIPQFDHLYLRIRYSKYSDSRVPIDVYIDDESTPRASFYPENQENWNKFSCWVDVTGLGRADAIDLGSVISGTHSIKFDTEGQEFGVADLDIFRISNSPTGLPPCTPDS